MSRILVLLPEIPWPPVTGGKRAHLATISRLLASGCSLQIVACNTDTPDEALNEFLAGPYGHQTTVVATRSPGLAGSKWKRTISLLSGMLSIYPSHFAHIYRSSARTTVKTFINTGNFDIVWVDHLHAMAMLPERRTGPRLILSTQNVESELTLDTAKQAPFGIQKVKRYFDYMRTVPLEPQLLKKAQSIVCLSPNDADSIAKRFSLKAVGSLVPLNRAPEATWEAPPSPVLTFVGTYKFSPNQEAIIWIFRTFSHQLLLSDPRIEIRIVGGGDIPKNLRDMAAPNVRIHGRLSDSDFERVLRTSSALFSPIVLGSGIKMKVMDAALLGIPIIATSFSVVGLNFIKPALVISDRADQRNASRVAATINNPDALKKFSHATTEALKNLESANQLLLNQLLSR